MISESVEIRQRSGFIDRYLNRAQYDANENSGWYGGKLYLLIVTEICHLTILSSEKCSNSMEGYEMQNYQF